MSLTPTTMEELAAAVRATSQVMAVGRRTKPLLSRLPKGFLALSTERLHGIVEYEPDEFTVTARAGTPVADLSAALAERGQYLPFEPMFQERGATLGGTLAAGTSGPGRFRYGGVRDFVLGIRFVDGMGRLLRMGGKVVKNAAGFDLPKFFVGSLGRFGILGEVTLKVFPRPRGMRTLRWRTECLETAAVVLAELGRSRCEIDALDVPPEGTNVYARLAGPESAIDGIAAQLIDWRSGELVPGEEADTLWSDLRNAAWAADDRHLWKIPLTEKRMQDLFTVVRQFRESRLHLSAGGNVAFLSLPAGDAHGSLLSRELERVGLNALGLRGPSPARIGLMANYKIAESMKAALDPENRFPALDI